MEYIPAKFDHASEAILKSFFYLMGTKNKDYCYPSQRKILEILSKYHGINISLRTLNYKLKYLEKKGYIKRIRRITRNKKGIIEYSSTIYKIMKKGMRILKNIYYLTQRTVKFFKNTWNSRAMFTKAKEIKPEYLEDGRLDVSPYCKLVKEYLTG